jgi:hypothetical protein
MTSSPLRAGVHAAHAGRIAALELADVGRRRSGSPCPAGGEQHVVVLGEQRDADQASSSSSPSNFIAILPRSDVGERVHRVAAHRALGGREHDVERAPLASSSGSGSTVEIVSPSASGSRLIIGRPRVAGRPRAGARPSSDRPCRGGEEQHRRVRRGDEQLGDRVLVLGRHAGAALAAARLRAERVERGALDVAPMVTVTTMSSRSIRSSSSMPSAAAAISVLRGVANSRTASSSSRITS